MWCDGGTAPERGAAGRQSEAHHTRERADYAALALRRAFAPVREDDGFDVLLARLDRTGR